MASPTITTGLTAFIPNYWDRLLGDNLRPNLYLYDLGEKRKLPANFGTTIKIPRIKKAGGRAIWGDTTEGAATGTCALSSEFVSGTLVKFRGAYKHSDLVIMTALSDVVQLSLEDISYDLAQRMDIHIRGKLSNLGPQFAPITGKTQPSNIVGGVSLRQLALNDGQLIGLRAKDIIFNEIKLEEQNNPRYPGTNKYAAVIHPKVKYDVMTSTSSTFAGWIDVNKYNNAEKIFNGEIGSLLGFKFITSTNMFTSTTDLSLDAGTAVTPTAVTRSFFLAPRAYYVTELSEMSARTFVKQLGSAGAADPTNDFATVGAKVFFTAIPGGSAFSSSSSETRLVRFISATSV